MSPRSLFIFISVTFNLSQFDCAKFLDTQSPSEYAGVSKKRVSIKLYPLAMVADETGRAAVLDLQAKMR